MSFVYVCFFFILTFIYILAIHLQNGVLLFHVDGGKGKAKWQVAKEKTGGNITVCS